MRPILTLSLKHAFSANKDKRVPIFVECLSELSSPDIPSIIRPFIVPKQDTTMWVAGSLKTNPSIDKLAEEDLKKLTKNHEYIFSNEIRKHKWQGKYVKTFLELLYQELSNDQSTDSNLISSVAAKRAEKLFKKLISNGINRYWINWSLLEREEVHKAIASESLEKLEETLSNLFINTGLDRFVILAPVEPKSGHYRGYFWELKYGKLNEIDKAAVASLTKNFSLKEGDIKSQNFTCSLREFSQDTLTQCSYFITEKETSDPFNAIDLFTSEIQTIQRVIDVSKTSMNKENIHYRKRNAGGVFKTVLGPTFVLKGRIDNDRYPFLLCEFEYQRFPIKRLISESKKFIGLLHFFCSKCERMKRLAAIFSDAINATRQRRAEDAFRYLGTGLEILLPSRIQNDSNMPDKFDFEGASILLTFEQIRAQFEWLNRRLVPPGKTKRQRLWQNHIIIFNDKQWREYVQEEKPRELIQLHRETLISYLKNSRTVLPQRKIFFESILSGLRMQRNYLAHGSVSNKDDYFLPIALDYFRTALQLRFHCYLLWLEWHLGSKINMTDPEVGHLEWEGAFQDGWLEELERWSKLIPEHFKEITQTAFSYRKVLCLGAGYSGLFMTPQDKKPIQPLIYNDNNSVDSILRRKQSDEAQ
jgi:hypothetical protein